MAVGRGERNMIKIRIFATMKSSPTDIERHPLTPFTPRGARILLLGSFPPPHHRWSMEFFYPNFQNDMWRIMGLLFHDDHDRFVIAAERRFDLDAVVEFCTTRGIAIFDTATAVRRLNNDASDKFLEVVEPTDIATLVGSMPDLQAVVTTGEKATDVIVATAGCEKPKVGESTTLHLNGRVLRFYRMPSSSRAYPLSIERKAEKYGAMLRELEIL